MRAARAPILLCLCALGACNPVGEPDADEEAQIAAVRTEEPPAAAGGDRGPIELLGLAPNPRTGLCARRSGHTPIDAAGLSLASPSDYVAVRQWTGSWKPGTDVWQRRGLDTLSETGSACAAATRGDCAADLARQPDPEHASYCGQVCVKWSAVTTRGDQVQYWAERDEILALLGPIDTIDDALLVVMSHGYSVACPPLYAPYPREISIDVQPVEDGFELTATRTIGSCPAAIERYKLFVSRAGTVTVLDVATLPWGVCA